MHSESYQPDRALVEQTARLDFEEHIYPVVGRGRLHWEDLPEETRENLRARTESVLACAMHYCSLGPRA